MQSDFFTVPCGIWKAENLTGLDILTLVTLFYCKEHGARTSRKALARLTHSSLKTVDRCTSKLAGLGYITKELHRADDMAFLANTYTVNDVCGQQE